MIQSTSKKIFRFIVFHDWTWSVLFSFLAYWLVNYGPPSLFGIAMTYYAINWLQALLSTAGVMAGIMAIGRMGMWFYFRKLHNYIYGTKVRPQDPDKVDPNKPKIDPEKARKYWNHSFGDFTNKQNAPWIRLCFASFWFLVLLSFTLIVFLKFLSAGSVSM